MAAYSTPSSEAALLHRLPEARTGRGGPRPGAGRPSGPRPRVPHRRRETLTGSCPLHVTVRVRPDVPSLRTVAVVRAFRRSLARGSERGDFRVAHYALQGDHAHLIVEASSKRALANGMNSIGARLARAVNRVAGRQGPVLDGRYHQRVLGTPREVRRALAYVLTNARRHLQKSRRSTIGGSRVPFDPALVRRVAVADRHPLARGLRSPRNRSPTDLAAPGRLAPSRGHRSGDRMRVAPATLHPLQSHTRLGSASAARVDDLRAPRIPRRRGD